MEKIFSILAQIRPEFDFKASQDFVADGLLDSFDLIGLVSELEGQFGILIDAMDITPEYFKSAAAIENLVRKNGGNP